MNPNRTLRAPLLVALAALAVGLFFRFWGLGGAPLAVDEYFLGTSILNTAARGLPEFACGGFYTRGVLTQYLSVPLLWLGQSIEFTVRFWPALASALTILAAWKLGLRAGGTGAAVIATVLVSLSLWEVEFGRFGRMYAPFQAQFLWYLYFQVRHLLDGREYGRWSYLALSGLAILTYEGAAMLLALNFLAFVWPGRRWSWSHAIAASGLLAFGYLFHTIDFRRYGYALEELPPRAGVAAASTGIELPVRLPDFPAQFWPILITGLALVTWTIWRYRIRLRPPGPATLFWVMPMLALAMGWVVLAGALCAVGLLLRLPWPVKEELPSASRLLTLLALSTVPWLAIVATAYLMSADINVSTGLTLAADYVLNYPDVYRPIVKPWLSTIPVTSIMLALLACVATWRAFSDIGSPSSASIETLRYLLATSILMVLLVAVLPQPYWITRYTYFLYPVILILAATGTWIVAQAACSTQPARSVVAVGIVSALFLFAEDFRVSHLIAINRPEIRYRTAYDPDLADHYYTRWDFRGAAEYVNDRLGTLDSVIVFDQPLPHYLERTTGIFVRYGTDIHGMVWGCRGTRDLWSNAPLLDEAAEVERTVAETRGSVWLVMRSERYPWRDPLEIELAARYKNALEFTSQDRNLAVYRLRPHVPTGQDLR